MLIEKLDLERISTQYAAAWNAFQNASGQGGPFHSLTFARLVACIRGDVQAIAFVENTLPVAFLAVQRPSVFAASPVGAPINDMHGVTGDPSLRCSAPNICTALEVGRLDFTHVSSDQTLFAAGARGAVEAWYSDLSPGRDSFMTALKKKRGMFVYHIGRQGRQISREHGDVQFNAYSRDRKHLEMLLDWKVQQLRDTRQPLVWSTPWLRQLIFESFQTDTPDFGGVLFTLTIGDRLIAANFCLRGPRALHGLLMCHDAAFEHYSPGKQLGLRVVEWAAANGFQEMLFGPGDSLFKRQLGTHQRTLNWGYLSRPSWSASVRGAAYAARAQIEKTPSPWVANLPGRAMRRLDLHRALNAPHAALKGKRLGAFGATPLSVDTP